MRFFKKLIYIGLSTLILAASGLTLSSCSGSKGCLYDASQYQIKNSRTGMNRNYKPRPFKHQEPVRKKWIINNKRKPSLGNN